MAENFNKILLQIGTSSEISIGLRSSSRSSIIVYHVWVMLATGKGQIIFTFQFTVHIKASIIFLKQRVGKNSFCELKKRQSVWKNISLKVIIPRSHKYVSCTCSHPRLPNILSSCTLMKNILTFSVRKWNGIIWKTEVFIHISNNLFYYYYREMLMSI